MGREVVRSLNQRGVTPRVLVRDPSRLRPTDQVEIHRGDLRDPASLREAMRGIDAVFHISPHEADEVELTRTVLDAVEREGARLVFSGIHIDASNRLARWAMRTVYGRLLPRYRGKISIGHLVEISNTRPVVLGVGNFMQCDEALLDVIRAGQFVLPTHREGLNRVDLRDLGDIVANVLLDPTIPAGAYPVVGPRSLTGAECARTWSQALGIPVTYVGDDDAAIDAALEAHLTGYRLEDWESSFRALRGFAVTAKKSEIDATTRLLGRPPTDFTEFVGRIVDEHGLAPATATGADGIPANEDARGTAVKQLDLPGQTHVAEGPHDHTGMHVMHHAFRRDLARFAAAATATPLGEPDTWAALGERWDRFCHVLHEHHHSEDTLYWPVLDTAVRARGTDADRAEVAAMSDEHAEIDPTLTALTTAFRAMADHPCEDRRHAIEIRLAGLREVLGAHLEHEETVVLPLVQRVMTEGEFAEVEREIQKGYRLRDTPFIIGWVVDGLPQEALERFFAFSGPPCKLLYAVVRRSYARREQRAFRHAGLVGAPSHTV
ncbi:hypothetical protein ASG74_10365 [Knoellia sp. Soil729]|nr:hypothetical protein ASG74_10365 [Knoellia sp. Soil729]